MVAAVNSAVRSNRMPVSECIPSYEDLIARKKKKKLLTTGSELFNNHPSKGTRFATLDAFNSANERIVNTRTIHVHTHS